MKNIALHSVPRSGSSWLGSILDSSSNVAYRYQPLFSYTHKDFLNHNSTYNEIESFFKSIYLTEDEFVLQKKAKENQLIPNFNKKEITHIIYKEVRYHKIVKNLIKQSNDIKVIGLVRSPFAVINSWIKAPKEFRKNLGWKIENEWKNAPAKNMNRVEEFNGYNKWKEVCFLFLKLKKEYPDQFYLINYDDLISSTVFEVKQLFKFCELNYTNQTEAFIKESTSVHLNDAYAVFKYKIDDMGWKKTLPSYIEKEIINDADFKILNQHFKWI